MKKLSVVATTAAVLASAAIDIAPANAAQFVRENIKIDFSSKTNNDGSIQNLEKGHILTGDEWSNYGLGVSVDTNRNGSGNRNIDDSRRLTLYDTTSNGRDNDLRTGSQWGTEAYGGNALIIQESWKGGNDRHNWKTNDAGTQYLNPDDDAAGGTITFDFLSADVNYIYEDLNIGLHDIDGPESAKITVFYTDEEGNQQQASELLNASDPDASSNVTLLSSREVWDDHQAAGRHQNNSLWNFNFDIDNALKGLFSLDKVEVEYSGSGAVAYLEYDRFSKADYEVEVPEPGSVMALLALGAFGGHSVLKRKKH